MLEPDRRAIETFYGALFPHCGVAGYASLRVFSHQNKPFYMRLWKAPVANRNHLIDVAVDLARRAANNGEPAIFCPPIATFDDANGRAREKDLCLGLALSVECDQNPNGSRQRLQEILGEATVIVKSGGVWINGGDEPEDKLHLHWRLKRPAEKPDHEKLKRARRLAASIPNFARLAYLRRRLHAPEMPFAELPQAFPWQRRRWALVVEVRRIEAALCGHAGDVSATLEKRYGRDRRRRDP
jgi:hypothetical protein